MLFIILYNAMVIVVATLMIVAALMIKGKLKWTFSPILLVIAITVFVIPNISYFKAPFATPFKVVITESGKPIDDVNVITARGLEFTSFFAHIPTVTWRDVDIKATDSNGEVAFGRKLKYMTIDLGIIGNWRDSNDISYFCIKNGYRYMSEITNPKKVILAQTDKNIKGTGYYNGINLLELDSKYIFATFSRKSKQLINLYLINNR